MAQTSRKHALIIVDLQKDFLPGGALAVPGGDKIVPVIHEVLEKNSWDCIVMTQDWHPAGHVSFARNHEGRHVLDVIRKGRELNIDSYSAFCAADNETKTGLAGCLRERGITDVWVCGLALDYCVSFTAIDAAREGFDTHVITDASAAIDANGSLEKAEAAWRLACIDVCIAEDVLEPEY